MIPLGGHRRKRRGAKEGTTDGADNSFMVPATTVYLRPEFLPSKRYWTLKLNYAYKYNNIS